jgi:hypothetical protein
MTPANEARRILEIHKNDDASALAVLERQLGVINTRADVIMSLAGITITVTGFSGRLIAATDRLAQVCIVSALVFVIASVAWVFLTVGPICWITSDLEGDTLSALVRIIERRNRRTRAYMIGGVILCIGIALYAAAIGIMLLNPGPVAVPIR